MDGMGGLLLNNGLNGAKRLNGWNDWNGIDCEQGIFVSIVRNTKPSRNLRNPNGRLFAFLKFILHPFAFILPEVPLRHAHGYAHIDRYNLRGRTKKDRLSLAFSEALSRAERDIKQNWSVYRERFLKGEWPCELWKRN